MLQPVRMGYKATSGRTKLIGLTLACVCFLLLFGKALLGIVLLELGYAGFFNWLRGE